MKSYRSDTSVDVFSVLVSASDSVLCFSPPPDDIAGDSIIVNLVENKRGEIYIQISRRVSFSGKIENYTQIICVCARTVKHISLFPCSSRIFLNTNTANLGWIRFIFNVSRIFNGSVFIPVDYRKFSNFY